MSLQEKLKKLRVHSHGLGLVKKWEVLEAVREVVSQIQARIDKLVQDRNRVPLLEINKQALLNTRILELEWVHFLITGETYKALLVSPSTPTFIHIPFLAEFKDVMLSGKKIVTSRTKRYGKKGDCFKAFGATFKIRFVEKMPLGDVSCFWYEREGFGSQDKFIEIWKRIHPRKGFVSTQRVWVHGFKLLEGSAPTDSLEAFQNDGKTPSKNLSREKEAKQ